MEINFYSVLATIGLVALVASIVITFANFIKIKLMEDKIDRMGATINMMLSSVEENNSQE